MITAMDCQGMVNRVENAITEPEVQRLASDPGVETAEIVAYVVQALARKLTMPHDNDEQTISNLVNAAATAIVGATVLRYRCVGQGR